mmetsp:Transcript_58419/g.153890  ORF Transcript_58419/g.153890 Transcript_58419/m.153890 type:complete len:290 (-) Transcript_58419:297-1166(-)
MMTGLAFAFFQGPIHVRVAPAGRDQPPAAGQANPPSKECALSSRSRAFFDQLLATHNISRAYFNGQHDRCYCDYCYNSFMPDVIVAGPTQYIVPRGWYRFGIDVPRGLVQQEDIFRKWSVSFHGTRAYLLKSLLSNGLAMPGDKLLDGSILASHNCAGRQDHCIYTSPTIRYAGLGFYTSITEFSFNGQNLVGQTVLQCRQQPGTYRMQGETMGFRSRWNQQVLCLALPDQSQVEWTTEVRAGVVPYGLLVRVFEPGSLPDNFESPVDNGRSGISVCLTVSFCFSAFCA